MAKNDLLNNIRIYQFCALDLNLYLDNFPTDENAVDDYCKVSAKLLIMKKIMAHLEISEMHFMNVLKNG